MPSISLVNCFRLCLGSSFSHGSDLKRYLTCASRVCGSGYRLGREDEGALGIGNLVLLD